MLIDGVLSDGEASDGACWLWLCDIGREGRAGQHLVGGRGRAEGEEEGGKRKSITARARGKGGRNGRPRGEK